MVDFFKSLRSIVLETMLSNVSTDSFQGLVCGVKAVDDGNVKLETETKPGAGYVAWELVVGVFFFRFLQMGMCLKYNTHIKLNIVYGLGTGTSSQIATPVLTSITR